MLVRDLRAGLTLRFSPPPIPSAAPDRVITEEAGLVPGAGETWRITPLVAEGAVVAEGAALAHLRGMPEVCLVAPMPARVARIALLPGHRLS